MNSASCAVAALRRLTGKDPNAVAEPPTIYRGLSYFNDDVLGFIDRQTPKSIEKLMLEQGDGAAGIVIINQQDGIAHAINVVNRNGKVTFIDAQIGKIVELREDLDLLLGRP